MNWRCFGTTDNAELRAKIDKANFLLPLPYLMRRLRIDDKHIGKTALCPWHDDHNPSFSVFQRKDGTWWHQCFVGCSSGDEIAFLVKHFSISRREAITRYLEMAGFPPVLVSKSHECLASTASPECPAFPASPVSEGQMLNGELEAVLKGLAAQSACTQFNTARLRRWKLLQDLKAVQKQIGRKLKVAELSIAFDEWHKGSLPSLDPTKTRDQYEAKFFSEFGKVRFATGDGTLATALENVAKLSVDQLPKIPDKPNAHESWRRLAALHRELWRLRKKSTYFLDYRSAAKVFDAMTHQKAHDITHALVFFGVIEFVSKGKPGLNSGTAAKFRYLLKRPAKKGLGDSLRDFRIV